MITLGSLRLIDDEATPPPPEKLKVFTRLVTTPPGLPWEQIRGADLEARHGAPLPLSQLSYRLRRLAPWGFGQPGRFAIFYVLAVEIKGRYTASAEIDGRPIEVTFVTAGEQAQGVRKLAGVGLGVAAVLVLTGFSITKALEKRAATTAELVALEQLSSSKLRAQRKAQRARVQSEALNKAASEEQSLSEALGDLSWVAGARAPEAQFDAVHWERGVVAVEMRGPAAPFRSAGGRSVERAVEPLRPGVWLWGVRRTTPSGSAKREMSAAVKKSDGDGR